MARDWWKWVLWIAPLVIGAVMVVASMSSIFSPETTRLEELSAEVIYLRESQSEQFYRGYEFACNDALDFFLTEWTEEERQKACASIVGDSRELDDFSKDSGGQ